ncbi:MAG: beta-ketoacyl synthase N-terminal-like domain-containing protein [Anaerolineales bacterium]|jgi:acetyl-CoA C-acetyltransferase
MGNKKLGRGVALVGAGMSKFGAFPEKSSRDLFVEAFQSMRQSVDTDFDPADIETIYIGNFSSDLFESQSHTAPIMADVVGLASRPATRIEDACASSGVALRQGILAIASGLYDIVLVGGIEKMTNLPTAEVTDTLAAAADTLYEIPAGFTFPGFYAAIASAYMHKYGMKPEHLMNVAIKNHENGALNPNAQFGMTIPAWMESRKAAAQKKGKPVPSWGNVMDFLHDDRANPMIAWPLRLFDCSPITDGATALLLVAEDIARQFTDHPLHIIGSGQASDVALHDRDDLTTIYAARRASQEAYGMAGVTPKDIRVAEVHDCFTIAEVVATEDLGFFKPGEGFKAAEDQVTARDGAKPINTSGGLKSKGHPVGASGAGQAVEIFKQMREQAGERQVVGDIPLALTHNVGGTGGTCVVHIYERRD